MPSILVTGASSGIGAAVAARYLDEGWTVGLVARRADRLADVAGGREGAVVLPADVTDAQAVERVFSGFVERAGRLDVLFNNAGIFTPPALIDEIALEDWRAALSVNLDAMFLCARRLRADAPARSARGADHQQRLGVGACPAPGVGDLHHDQACGDRVDPHAQP